MSRALFEKILVPLDGSENSEKALEKAVQIAKRFGGKLTLLHAYLASVQPVMMPEPTGLSSPIVPVLTAAEVSRVVDAARSAGKRILEDGAAKALSDGVQVEKLLVEGHAVREIVRTAKEGRYDLVVIGARGMSRIKELFLGSVTDGVVHHALCPVLVVK